MQSVKVRSGGIAPDEVSEVISSGLGGDYEVRADGSAVLVRKGTFNRAKVAMREEPGGTVFEIRPDRPPLPLMALVVGLVNGGLVRRIATLLGQAEQFSDSR